MSKLIKKEARARVALFTASVIWGTTFIAISETGDFFQPAFLLMLRCLLSGIMLLFVFRKRLSKFSFRYITAGALLGIIMAGGYLIQAMALTTAGCPPGRCGFLVATYCVLTPFVSWAMEGKKPTIYNIVAAVLCLGGVLCISLPTMLAEASVGVSLGDIYALVSSLIFAVYLVYIAQYMKLYDPILLTIVHLFFAAFYSGLYTVFFEDNSGTVWTLHSTLAIFYLSVICMGFTNVLQAIGQRDTPASTAALIFSLESVFGIIFAVILLNEEVSFMLFLGCVLIFVSIIISETQLNFLKHRMSRSLFQKIDKRTRRKP